jgi:hypothetical protein
MYIFLICDDYSTLTIRGTKVTQTLSQCCWNNFKYFYIDNVTENDEITIDCVNTCGAGGMNVSYIWNKCLYTLPQNGMEGIANIIRYTVTQNSGWSYMWVDYVADLLPWMKNFIRMVDAANCSGNASTRMTVKFNVGSANSSFGNKLWCYLGIDDSGELLINNKSVHRKENAWNQMDEFTVDNVKDGDTLKVKCRNNGGPGGVSLTYVYKGMITSLPSNIPNFNNVINVLIIDSSSNTKPGNYTGGSVKNNLFFNKNNWIQASCSNCNFEISTTVYGSVSSLSCNSYAPKWTFQDSMYKWYTVKQNGYKTTWPNLGIKNNSNMSISFWLNMNTIFPDWRNIFHFTNTNNNCCNSGDRNPAIWVNPNGTDLHLASSTYSNQWNNYNNYFQTGTLPSKTELFITIVMDVLNVYVYVNGKLQVKKTYSTRPTPANSNTILYIGDPWYNSDGGILIKNFSLYDCSLSSSNVLQLYNTELTATCSYQLSATEQQCYKNNYPQDLSDMDGAQLQNHWSTIGCNQIRNNQCPSQQSSSGIYNYQGCYNDTQTRAIPKYEKNVKTIDECAQIAETNKKNVFGVQYYGQCWTGDNPNDAYKYEANFNKNSCPPLGGAWVNQVYLRNVPFKKGTTPPPYLTKSNFSDTIESKHTSPPPSKKKTMKGFGLKYILENYENILDEENKEENIRNTFKYIIVIVIIILLFIFMKIMLKK